MLNEMQFSHTELPNTKKLPYQNVKATQPTTKILQVTPTVRGQAGGKWRSKHAHTKREKLKTKKQGGPQMHKGEENRLSST